METFPVDSAPAARWTHPWTFQESISQHEGPRYSGTLSTGIGKLTLPTLILAHAGMIRRVGIAQGLMGVRDCKNAAETGSSRDGKAWLWRPSAPPGMYKTMPTFYRYLPCQLVQDFFHQQYHAFLLSWLRRVSMQNKVPMSDASLRCCWKWCTWRHCSTDGHGTCATCRWIWRFRGIPKCSMYGVFTYIYHKFRPNLGKYTIHWAYGIYIFHSADPWDWQIYLLKISKHVLSNTD